MTHDPVVIAEVQTLWEAHGCKEPMSIAIPSQGSQADGPIMSIWWKPGKNKGVRPTMQRVQVHQIQERSGPVPKTATKVTIPKKQGPVMVTLRLLTPEFYRRLFVPEAEKKSPTTIISRWARLAQCSVSTLTGGRWERVIHKHGSFLIAHLRVSKDLASRIISHSGTDGLFATQVPSRDFPQDPVAWVPRKQAMSGEDYFKFVQGLSKSKGLPLAIRQGGQADLGLINGKQSDFPREGTRLWCIRSVPRHWQREDVENFLHAVSWQSIEIQKRQKGRGKGAGPEWVFKASPPVGTSVEQSFFHYADEDMNLTIHANWSSQRKNPEVEWLWGPKKTWTDKDFPPLDANKEIKDTQLDTQLDTQSNTESPDCTQPTSTQPGDVDARDRSPRRQVHKTSGSTKQEPDQIILTEVPSWSIKDAGGQGDCGFRALAASLAQEQGKTLSTNGLEREGANLRVLAVQRLRSHPKFRDKWAVDHEEKDANLSAIQSFDDYLSAASKKSFWIDGLLLKGLAEKLDRNLVIFKWKRGENYWQRFFISGKVSSKSADCKNPTIPLLLKEEHYRALLRPEQDTKAEVPEAWTCPTTEQHRGDLRGQGSRHTPTKSSSRSEENALVLPSPDRTCGSVILSLPSPDRVLSEIGPNSVHLSLDQTPVSAATLKTQALNKEQFGLGSAHRDKVYDQVPGQSSGLHFRITGKQTIDVKKPWQVKRCINKQQLRPTNTVRSQRSRNSGLSLPSPDKSTRSKNKSQASNSVFSNLQDGDKLSLPDVDRISNTFASVGGLPNPRQKSPCSRDPPSKVQCFETKKDQDMRSANVPRKRFRAAKHENFRKNRRIQEVIQAQNSKSNKVHAPANQGLGGLPVFPASNLHVPWWTCSLCDFQKPKNATDKKNDPYNARVQHLRNAHGAAPTPLAKGGFLENPSRLDKANQGLARRWKEKYALFQKKKWNGRAHDIGPDPDHWRQYTAKATGNVWTKALYKCRKCEICVSASDLPHHPCKLAKGPIPSLAERKEIWKSCNPPVLHPGRKKQSSKQKPEAVRIRPKSRSSLSKQVRGTAPNCRGLRAVRVGEASHPGPGSEASQQKHHLKIWSQNVRSWHANGQELLSKAIDEDVFVLALQETNITDIAFPGMASLCHRMGWQVAHVSPASKNRGGVAILCRKPCVLINIDKYSGPEGQYIMVQVHADQRVFNMYSHYRHATDSEFFNLHAICEQVERNNAKDWCIALDGNANMLQGPCQELIARVGGTCVATAGHKQSSCPIDGIWVSPNLEVVSCHHNKPGDGDHGIAEVSLNLKIPKIRERLWRFSLIPPKLFSPKKIILMCHGLMWPPTILHGVVLWNMLNMLGILGVAMLPSGCMPIIL